MDETRPAVLQSFEPSSPTEMYGMFYKHQAGRYAPGLRNSLRGYDEEESNDEEYNSKYDFSTEIDPELEE
ncbi:hypothetical protein TNCV_3576091 [Trichonephila clavipes]|nr:hypothetical protein TNCV_3576091 [Trichonephila clavipes]